MRRGRNNESSSSNRINFATGYATTAVRPIQTIYEQVVLDGNSHNKNNKYDNNNNNNADTSSTPTTLNTITLGIDDDHKNDDLTIIIDSILFCLL